VTLTLKVVSESRVTWVTSVPILVFLSLSVLDLDPMYATDRQLDVRQHHRLMPPPIRGGGIIINAGPALIIMPPPLFFVGTQREYSVEAHQIELPATWSAVIG